jgi:hypothetical protein
MRQYLAIAFLAVGVTACAHDTQQSIRQDAGEKGRFTTPNAPNVVFGNMEAQFNKCFANWRRARTYVDASPAPRPGAIATVALIQSAPTGTRVFVLVDVTPSSTGSEVAFYKSRAHSVFVDVRPYIEKWAKGDDLTC